jgi:hypothetical protein
MHAHPGRTPPTRPSDRESCTLPINLTKRAYNFVIFLKLRLEIVHKTNSMSCSYLESAAFLVYYF